MEKESKINSIREACTVLGLGETATLDKIKKNFRKLSKKWHPDKDRRSGKKEKEKMQSIIKAYREIMNYCSNYEYSFHEDEVKKYISYDELWDLKFGNDPLYANENEGKKSEKK